MFDPAHPGEILREFIPESMTVTECASRLGVSRVALSKILNGKSGISAEMAIRIGLLTGTTPESWLDNQLRWELFRAEGHARPEIFPFSRVSGEKEGLSRERADFRRLGKGDQSNQSVL